MPHDPVTRQDVLDEVSKVSGQMEKMKDTLDRWRVQAQVKIDKHDSALFGNGHPGMDEQIRQISTYMSVLIKLGWIVIGTLVTSLVAGIIAATVYLIKVIP